MGAIIMKKSIFIACIGSCIATTAMGAEAPLNCNMQQPTSRKEAQCLLILHNKIKHKDQELREITRRQIKKGAHYFKIKDYDNAYEAYDLARINAVNAYSYIVLGDTVVAQLAGATEFWGDDSKENGACLTPRHFNEFVDLTLTHRWEVGTELAKILKTPPVVSRAMIAKTEKKMRCMRELAAHYNQTKPACVDLAKVDACYTGVAAKVAEVKKVR